MPQVTQGIRSVLSISSVYRLFGQLIGGASGRKIFVKDHIRPQQGDLILDIGCGPGAMLPYLSDVQYVSILVWTNWLRAMSKQMTWKKLLNR